MAVQVRETVLKVLDPKRIPQFGAWKINIPTHKQAILNALNLWFILARLLDQTKTLLKLIPFRQVSFLKKSKSKGKKTPSQNSSKTDPSKPKLKTSILPGKEDKKPKTFFHPRKPLDKTLESHLFNWKCFSDNFYFPSIFIQNADFVEETLEPIVLDAEPMDLLTDFVKNHLNDQPKDKFHRKLVKFFLRLVLVRPRQFKRDQDVLSYLSDLVSANKHSIKRGTRP